MRALVVGGSRFIGLHLVRTLSKEGHSVTVLNRGQTEVTFPGGVERLYADRNDSSQVEAALHGKSFDTVFDISAYTPSVLGLTVKALQGNIGHYLFCSTGAVFGPPDHPIHIAPIPAGYPLDRNPQSHPYTVGKVQCEDLLAEAFRGNGFPATSLRPVYVYGPGNLSRATEPSYFARLTLRRKVIIPGDGFTLFHLVHVEDVVGAFMAAATTSASIGQAYNIGGPEGVTGDGYVQTIALIMGVEPDVVHVEISELEAISLRLGLEQVPRIYPFPHQVSRVCGIEKAKQDLGWSPRYGTSEGLSMTYDWWRRHGERAESWDFSTEDSILKLINSNGVP